ncbi:proline rich transmembrane protein 1B-like [Mytilus edulis]|uniref:proline rich transmembrane protein 1B-like n=1 Tax=Mytilus edulis TaxID=6550 RepID=UPI0039EFA667
MASSSEQPPPYSPPDQQQGQQPGQQPEQQPGQQYIYKFVQQNSLGFFQSHPPKEGYSDISSGYGYIQQPQMAPPMMNTTTTNVVVCQPQAGQTIIINPAPYSYMTPAVLTCLFCCWVTGIGAIVAASMSQSQASEMKYDEARKSAAIARILTLVTICCGIGGYIILIAVTATK